MRQAESNFRPQGRREITMSAMDAIYRRRAVRTYAPDMVAREDIEILLSAAVQAPTAMHGEPWAFAVIQDRRLLQKLSDSTQAMMDENMRMRLPETFQDGDFNIFYNAGTLIVIYGADSGPFVAADCWLAAENLMLAACAMNLGTCVIGLAVPALNAPEWKRELGIPPEMTAYVPIVLGEAEHYPVNGFRKNPRIICWKSPG